MHYAFKSELAFHSTVKNHWIRAGENTESYQILMRTICTNVTNP